RQQDSRFAAAFREFGIDVDALEIAEVAARIGRTNITAAIVKALDGWAAVRRTTRNDEAWRKLVEIPRLVDRDERMHLVRAALLTRDREALEKLAAEVLPRKFSPATLLLLGNTLQNLGCTTKVVIDVLEKAQRQYPDDLWLNDALGTMYLYKFQPRRHA